MKTLPSRSTFLFCTFVLLALWAAAGTAHAQIFVTSEGSPVAEYNATTGAPISNPSLVGSPVGIAVSGTTLYTGDEIYNFATGTSISALIGGNSMAVSGSTLYVADFGDVNSSTIAEYNANTGALITSTFIAGLNAPWSIAISGSNLFVTQLAQGLNEAGISEWNSSTGALINGAFVTGLNTPTGLAISGNNLFVSDNGTGKIGEYNATTGATISASFVAGLSGNFGISILGSKLFVAETTGTIGEYDATTGAPINASLVTGLGDGPIELAVGVPEPSTYAALAGLGALGLALIRRRRREIKDVAPSLTA